MGTLLAAITFLLFTSAIASGSEAALFSSSIGEIRSAVDQGRRGAASLQRIKDSMARPIMAIVILNNISNIVGSILVGAIAADVLGSQWLGLFTAALTFVVILFAEILPKTLGEQHALRIALLCAPPILWWTRLLTPLIWVIELAVRPLQSGRPITSESEIRSLAKLGDEHGIIEEDEAELIQRVFRLNDVKAAGIMTPRPWVDRVDASRPVGELRDWLIAATHTRIVAVEDDDLDHVVGVVNVRDLLAALARGEHAPPVAAYVQPADFIPGSLSGDDLLRHFQASQRHLAVVVDELGVVLGVVTLEDVIEELVGDIVDETDIEEIEIRSLEGGGVLVRASVTMAELRAAIGVSPIPVGGVGAWLLAELGRIPEEGEHLELGGFSVHVVDASPRRIRWVEIRGAGHHGEAPA